MVPRECYAHSAPHIPPHAPPPHAMALAWTSPTPASFTRVGIGVHAAVNRRAGRGKPPRRHPVGARTRVCAARDVVEDSTDALDRTMDVRDDVVTEADDAPVERVIDGEECVKATRTIKTRAKTGEEASTSANANARASRRRHATPKEITPRPVENADRMQGVIGRPRKKSLGARWAKAKVGAQGTKRDTSTRLEVDEELELFAAIKELLRLEQIEELMKDDDERARLQEVAQKGAIEVLAQRERFAKEIKRAFEPAWAARAGYKNVIELRAAVRAGKLARKKLVQRNIGLAARVGIRLFNQCASTDKGVMSQQDFVHEGVNGLIRASEKFDPSKGYKFSTYANAWIYQNVMRAVYANGRVIRLPDHVQMQKQRAFKQKSLLDGTSTMSAAAMSSTSIDFTVEKLQELDELCAVPLSLDFAGGDGDLEMDDTDIASYETRDGGVDMMTCDVERELLRDDLHRAFKTLTAKEQYVLKHRFGFVGEPKTLVSIAESLDLSPQGLQYVMSKAFKKLKFEEQENKSLLVHLDRTNDKPSDEVDEPIISITPKKRGRKKGGKNKPKPQQNTESGSPTVSALDLVRSIEL